MGFHCLSSLNTILPLMQTPLPRMLGKRSKSKRLENRSGLLRDESPIEFYWHRPLGAPEDCRRLTIKLKTTKTSLWALPLSLECTLAEINDHPRRLDTIEFDGTYDAWNALRATDWRDICHKIRRRNLRKITFYGGVSDAQRGSLLSLMPLIRSVEMHESTSHDRTLHVLSQMCQRLAELRMNYCSDLSEQQGDILLSMLQSRPTLRSLVLLHTKFSDPEKTVTRFCLALEESASLDEAEFGHMDDDTKEYLDVITKIHRMRHYYYAMRETTDLSAFIVADNALAVVQNWWRCTHRPDMGTERDSGDREKSQSLSRHLSYGSTGSC